MPKSWLVRGAEAGERARRRMELLGVTPNDHPIWQGWERAPIDCLGPSYAIIAPMLDRRTTSAIRKKTSRMGKAGRKAPLWSENEILRLRKVFPTASKTEIEAAFPGRTFQAVAKAARGRGIYRAPMPPKPTGIRILDQIFERARRSNYSLVDLDALGGSKGYFSQRRWRRNPSHLIHCRAVVQMGGTVRAKFK